MMSIPPSVVILAQGEGARSLSFLDESPLIWMVVLGAVVTLLAALAVSRCLGRPPITRTIIGGFASPYIMASWRRQRGLCVAAAVVVALAVSLGLLAALAWGDALVFVLVLPVFFAASVISLVNWRCPGCGTGMGMGWKPKFCPTCGAQLQ